MLGAFVVVIVGREQAALILVGERALVLPKVEPMLTPVLLFIDWVELARRAAAIEARPPADESPLDIESFRGGRRSLTLSSVFASSNEIFFLSPSVWLPSTCLAVFFVT